MKRIKLCKLYGTCQDENLYTLPCSVCTSDESTSTGSSRLLSELTKISWIYKNNGYKFFRQHDLLLLQNNSLIINIQPVGKLEPVHRSLGFREMGGGFFFLFYENFFFYFVTNSYSEFLG